VREIGVNCFVSHTHTHTNTHTHSTNTPCPSSAHGTPGQCRIRGPCFQSLGARIPACVSVCVRAFVWCLCVYVCVNVCACVCISKSVWLEHVLFENG